MEEDLGVEIVEQGNTAVIAFKATSISNTEKITAVSETINSFVEKKFPKTRLICFITVQ